MTQHITLNFSQIKTKQQFHDCIRQALNLPEHYGDNKDAFWDCLTDITEKTHVHIIGMAELEGQLKTLAEDYLQMMAEHEEKSTGTFMASIERS